MSVYRKFDAGDILNSVIHAQPHVILASGTLVSGSIASGTAVIVGWRGNTGTSGSLSLYEGIRSRFDVRGSDIVKSGVSIYPLDGMDTHSIDGVVFISGSYPATGSVRMVKIRRTAAGSVLTDVTDVDWYEEHFSPILGLYDYYGQYRDRFFTGSYDYYSLYFEHDLSYNSRAVFYSGSQLSSLSSSFTMEMRVKPTRITSSLQDFTIQSQRARWKFYITGSTGRLAWTDFATVVTSSVPLTAGIWQHVALTVSSGSASFYVDAIQAGATSYTGSLAPITGNLALTSSYLTVGAEVVLSQSVAVFDQGFAGFMFESRVWDAARTLAQLSGNYLRTITGSDSGSSHLLHYSRFNDGPISQVGSFTVGSGTTEYGRATNNGQFKNFLLAVALPRHPNWYPNDDQNFITSKTRIDRQIDMFRVLHVPSMFYGRQIATGSVRLVSNAFDNQRIVTVLNDDGRGGLYVSGSVTRKISGEEYAGRRWNKVGNVFYVEGLIVITDPSLLGFGSTEGDWTGRNDILEASFSGDQRITTKVFMCRLGQAQGNTSNNLTFSRTDPVDGRVTVKQADEATTWITAIGIYDDEHQLVAIAKLQPTRKRERDKLDFRLKMDF